MTYGSVLTDTVQSSTAGTAPTFKDGNGTQIGTLCRAWVNFNGTGTVAIRASFNVSSITDNGTGDYTVNFTTAMPDTNYATVLGGNTMSGASQVAVLSLLPYHTSTSYATTTSIRVVGQATGNGGVGADIPFCNVAIFR